MHMLDILEKFKIQQHGDWLVRFDFQLIYCILFNELYNNKNMLIYNVTANTCDSITFLSVFKNMFVFSITTADGHYSMKLKMPIWNQVMTNLDNILKARHCITKVCV